MNKKIQVPKISSSEITPEYAYLSRRKFLKLASASMTGFGLAACGISSPTKAKTSTTDGSISHSDEYGDPSTTIEDITHYNNYYEFSTDKVTVASLSENFTVSPWKVEVSGLVQHPRAFDVDELRKMFGQEERIYRMRCVEGWSMVIPWDGFPLAQLLKLVEPASSAKYVRFTTIFRPEEMPGQSSGLYPWPYQEGLRLDEALHDLTLLATGIYGKALSPQNGAPIRLVVPWKYGFKSIKSIAKIELVAEQPATMWSSISPQEYGFYSNVNPDRSHPRWSQASERRIGESGRRETMLFNGYESLVADLYKDMDLDRDY